MLFDRIRRDRGPFFLARVKLRAGQDLMRDRKTGQARSIEESPEYFQAVVEAARGLGYEPEVP